MKLFYSWFTHFYIYGFIVSSWILFVAGKNYVVGTPAEQIYGNAFVKSIIGAVGGNDRSQTGTEIGP